MTSALLLSYLKQLTDGNLQDLCQPEQDIEGNTHLPQLDGADISPVNIHQLGQLRLRKPLLLPVVHNIQAELLVKLPELIFQLPAPSFMYILHIEAVKMNRL